MWSDTEWMYSAFDRELLATFSSIRHFRYAREGHHYQLWTEHKPLLVPFIRSIISQPWTPRPQLSFIAKCTGYVLHEPGISNLVADTLSQLPDAPACNMSAAAHLSL